MNCTLIHRPVSHRTAVRAGFSITELLVVIGVIALLASLLLVAMGRVRDTAMSSQTLSTMASFAAACEAFQLEHGQYPGVIPERVLAQFPPVGDVESFTSTENALLHLMGGYRVIGPGDEPNSGTPSATDYDEYDHDLEFTFGDSDEKMWHLKIKYSDIGQGPVINGKPYAPYYTPTTSEVAVVFGQVDVGEDDEEVRIPDLLDAWGQPILYIRQVRTSGPLVGAWDDEPDRPQFLFGDSAQTLFGGMTAYLTSTALGEKREDQMYDPTDNTDGSILTAFEGDDEQRHATFAQLIRHAAFGEADDPLNGTARGAFVLISAGNDGIYFSATDGPGSDADPQIDITTGDNANPQVIEDYDDLRHFSGR